jgi:hypothetical protein
VPYTGHSVPDTGPLQLLLPPSLAVSHLCSILVRAKYNG